MPDVGRAVALFGLAGLLEIGAGRLVWQWAREDRVFWSRSSVQGW